jgi:hypothetical protein
VALTLITFTLVAGGQDEELSWAAFATANDESTESAIAAAKRVIRIAHPLFSVVELIIALADVDTRSVSAFGKRRQPYALGEDRFGRCDA